MGYITITSVTFSPPATGPQTITIRHRLTSDPDIPGSYTLDSSSVAVNQDGTLVAPFVIPGLLDNTSYTVKCNDNCSSSSFQQVIVIGTTTTSTSSTTTTTATPYTVHVTSTLGSTVLTNVSGLPGFTLSGPLSPGQTQWGYHNTFTGSISMTISGPPAVNGNAVLEKNHTIIDCQALLTSDTYPKTITFPSITFSSTDLIDLQLNNGAC